MHNYELLSVRINQMDGSPSLTSREMKRRQSLLLSSFIIVKFSVFSPFSKRKNSHGSTRSKGGLDLGGFLGEGKAT